MSPNLFRNIIHNNKMFKLISLLLIFNLHVQLSCQKDTTIQTPSTVDYTYETVVGDLDIPWGMDFLPDGSMLITEIDGRLLHVKNGQKKEIALAPKVYVRGQGGLLDVALHPDYKNNGWIYLTYASPEGETEGGNTALMRAKLKGDQLVDHEVLYKATPNTKRGHHFGSRIVFDQQGYVYFCIGDRGEHFVNPQDLTKDGGKVYRLHDDGKIPTDNPFYGEAEAKKAIFSYGHRNPQGMVRHPMTGEIWENEHGPQGGDEINIVEKGKNYGWPVISYGINYDNTILTDKTSMEGMEQPIYYYVPSIAPSGMAFLYSDIYPDWKGDLFIGSLKFQYLERLKLDQNKVVYREKILVDIGRVRNVKVGPDGYLYAAVEGKGILKIIPKK